MFERFGRLAEEVATSASRREFLGRLGRAALMATGAVAGVLAAPTIAEAGRRPLCDATSDAACIGLEEGSRCGGRDYIGRCKRVPGTSATCTCR